MTSLPTGKIDPEILKRLLAKFTYQDERVLIGAGIGEDATVIDMGRSYLVAKTDPITHVTGEIGYYAVHINANDIAAMGGRPLWFLATVLVPEGTDSKGLEKIFSQISETCRTQGIAYCGGHTEITTTVNEPVLIGQMLGEVSKKRLKPSSAARPGDDLLMTKHAAIEATSIMAIERERELRRRFGPGFIQKAKDYLFDPGISVLKEAEVVSGIAGVHALHDPTEGGITTGIYEMAVASGLGVKVDAHRIPVSEETRALCRYFGIDPLGTFASGSLLMAASPAASKKVLSALKRAGIAVSRIGRMEPKGKGLRLTRGKREGPLPVYHQDQLSKLFG